MELRGSVEWRFCPLHGAQGMSDESKEFQACLDLICSSSKRARNSHSVRWQAERVFNWCRENEARILYPGHPDYPFDLCRFENPPPFLSVWGEIPWRERRCIAVVGSREPSRLATEWMEVHLAEFIRRTGAVTVSGGARGVDLKAHMISLRTGQPTVVFLPSGLGRMYPREWIELKDDLTKTGGAIVSTYDPFQELRRWHFEERNRWIAAMGQVVFVVEARRRSGSSMTARLAREIDRTVCCLPGPPGLAYCAGSVDLLFEGGLPIRDADDLQVLFDLSSVKATRVELTDIAATDIVRA